MLTPATADNVLTYVDANIMIGGWRSLSSPGQEKMFDLVMCENRRFVACPLLRLEVIPQAQRSGTPNEVTFYEDFFSRVHLWVTMDEALSEAMKLVRDFRQGAIAYMDALHASAARFAGVHQFVTHEGVTKPFFKIPELNAVNIFDPTFVV